jgi:hypothetical protein
MKNRLCRFYWFCVLLITQLIWAIPIWAVPSGGGTGGGRGGGIVSYPSGRAWGFGGQRYSSPFWLIILFLLMVGLFWYFSLRQHYKLLNLLIILRRGQHYADELKKFSGHEPFDTPEERLHNFRALLDVLEPTDITSASIVHFGKSRSDEEDLNRVALSIWRAQEKISKSPLKRAKTREADDFCVISLTLVLGGAQHFSNGEGRTARSALKRLRGLMPNSLYFFLTSGANGHLNQSQAAALCQHLRSITVRKAAKKHLA